MTPFERGYWRFMKLAQDPHMGAWAKGKKTETKSNAEYPMTKKSSHAPPGSSPLDDPTMAADPTTVPGERPFSREDVQYMDSSPHPQESCGQCRFYQGDGTCAIVMGAVNPQGWCNRFQEEQQPSVAAY